MEFFRGFTQALPRIRTLPLVAALAFLPSDRNPHVECVCDSVSNRVDHLLDDESASVFTPHLELSRAIHEGRRAVQSRASGILHANDGTVSALYSGFQIFMPEHLPDSDSLEAKRLNQIGIVAGRYMMLFNDASERVPELERQHKYPEITARIRAELQEKRSELVRLLQQSGHAEWVQVVDAFEQECEIFLRATMNQQNASFEFAVEQKELANIIYEDFTTRLILGENPMANALNHPAQNYDDLRSKYEKYLNPPTTLSRQERGLLGMHYIAMSSQVWDDFGGMYEDQRFGILNPATQMLWAGASRRDVEVKMEELALLYSCRARGLNIVSTIVTVAEKGTRYGMPLLMARFKQGPDSMKHDSMNAMRIALAADGWDDPPESGG